MECGPMPFVVGAWIDMLGSVRNGAFIEQHLTRQLQRIDCNQLVIIPTQLKTSKQILTRCSLVMQGGVLQLGP